MNDDLIKRLSDPNRDWFEFGHDRREAADRIEELLNKNAGLFDLAAAEHTRAEAAQAKLAKAVEALQWIMNHRGECFIPEPWDDMANDVLAELEGK